MATEWADATRLEIIYAPGAGSDWIIDVATFAAGEPLQADSTARHTRGTILAVEQLVAECIDDHGPEVARVVHTFGGRDIHLRDGSRVEYRWQLVTWDWRCLDCGVDTDAIDEYYMLHNDLWIQANPNDSGQLCIGCVEGRLGRTLTAADFTDTPINTRNTRRSERLADRLSGGSRQVGSAVPCAEHW